MSREYNYGGTSLIVDSIEELFENGAVQTKTVSNIKQVIGLQRQSKDINKLKEQIESATDDGVITVSEKPGLKREWASLESSYATISDKFTQDDTLKQNSLFYVLKARFNELSPIMDEIFADMNSSYKNAEKVSKLTTLFVDCWEYITLCSQLLETKLSISDRFSLQISPTREIIGPLDIRVTLLYLTNGIYSDVTNQSTYLDSDFVWKKTSDENFERTGRVLSLTLDDMSSNEEQFTLTFKHTFTYEDPNATDVVIAKSISFAVSTGTLSQWTWSDAATKADLLMDPFAVWLDYRREFNTKKYLWRRDTNDLLKADSEKEWLYFRESGLDGLIGSNGYSRAVLELFKRSETTPASFDGGVITYTFSTNAISGDTGTWQKTIPNGEHPLYIIKATAFANTETDSISTGEWTTPAILSEHGTDGATGATAFSLVLYQRSEYSPSKPSDIVTYNIKTGAISGNGNWSLSFPSNNGYPCWAINATAFSYTDTDEITPSEWSDVQKLVENGKNGEDGADGKDAIPPKYQWRLGSSSTEPPVDTINHLADGAVSTFDGTVLAETNTGWLDVRPTPTPDLPYIWERMSSDGGLTWSAPYCLSINTIKNIEVVAIPASFNLNSRGVCDTLQTITCTIVRNNTIDPCFWTVTKDGNLTDIVATEGDSITFSVAVGETTKNIEVSAVCSGMARAVNIFGKVSGIVAPKKMNGIIENITQLNSITTLNNDGVTPLVMGDYALVRIPNGENHYLGVYRWSGSAWESVNGDESNYSEIMAGVLADALSDTTTVYPSTSAIYGFFQNLAVNSAFIESLTVWSLLVEKSKFSCEIGVFNNVPIFDVKYDGTTIFRIDPSTGRVFLGMPNAQVDAPETGFMYDPETGSIVSKNKNIEIDANGKIHAENGDFNGNIFAQSGTIECDIDTPSFSAKEGPPQGEKQNIFTIGTGAQAQFNNLLNMFNTLGWTYNQNYTIYSTTHPTIKRVYYTPGSASEISFYSDTGRVGTVSRRSGGSVTYSTDFNTNLELYTTTIVGGQIFKFKTIPVSDVDLEVGTVYRTSDGTLKVKI